MLLLHLITFRYSFQEDCLGTVPVFSDIASQFPGKYISSFRLLWLNWGLWFIYSCNFWKPFGFFTYLFPKFKEKFPPFSFKFVISPVIPEIHKSWAYHRLNAFKLIGMIFCNRSTLIILLNDAKYIHFLPNFSTSSSTFT